MSTFSLANSSTLNNGYVAQPHIYDQLYRVCQLFPIVPFFGIPGKFLQLAHDIIQVNSALYNGYNNSGDRGVRAMDPNATPGTNIGSTGTAEDQKVKDAYALVTTRTHYIKRFLGRVEINRALMENFRSDNRLVQHQIAAKLLALRYQFCDTMFNGTGTTEAARDFQGLDSIIAGLGALQTRNGTLSGGVANIESDLDALVYVIQAANGRCDFIVMNPVMFAIYCRNMTLKGVTIQSAWNPILGCMVPMHHGMVPILRSKFVVTGAIDPPPAPAATISTKVYAGVIGRHEGLFGIFQEGIGPNGVRTETMGPNSDSDKYEVEVAWHAGIGVVGENSIGALDYTGPRATQVPNPIS